MVPDLRGTSSLRRSWRAFHAIDPNGTGWADISVTKGNYVVLCFIPSPANQGKPHAALGMVFPVTVE